MISSAVDAGNELSAATQRHIDNCSDCEGFRQMCLSLGEGLRREATRRDAGDELPADFGPRVLATMPARGAGGFALPISPMGTLRRWVRPALAVACIACAALIGVLFLTYSPTKPPTPDSARIDGLYELMDDGHLRLRRTWAGLVRKPLASEIENLTQDTESAVRFLVACVAVDPTNAADELPN